MSGLKSPCSTSFCVLKFGFSKYQEFLQRSDSIQLPILYLILVIVANFLKSLVLGGAKVIILNMALSEFVKMLHKFAKIKHMIIFFIKFIQIK